VRLWEYPGRQDAAKAGPVTAIASMSSACLVIAATQASTRAKRCSGEASYPSTSAASLVAASRAVVAPPCPVATAVLSAHSGIHCHAEKARSSVGSPGLQKSQSMTVKPPKGRRMVS
jgi:hypothetical protein